MDAGKHIIARTLNDVDAAPFLKAGLGLEWLRQDESAAVFEGQAARAWEFILRKLSELGHLPSFELFRREFPEAGFRLPADPLPADELIDLAATESRRVLIHSMQMGIQDIFTRGDFGQGDSASVAEAEGLVRDALDRLSTVRSGGRRYRTASLKEMQALPEPDYLIEGALDAGTVCLLSGPSGKGKSFIALDWALSVASGSRWLDRRTKEGSVIYVAAEGYRGLGVRARSWQDEFGEVPEDNIVFVTEPVQLDDNGCAYLAELISERNAGLLVIDTFARCTAGVEENSAREVGLIIDRLYKLRDAIEEAGTTIVVVHHSGYDGKRARGSSALVAGVDCVTDIEGEDPHDGVTLKNSKRKDDDPMPPITVKLVKSGSSCVLEEADLQVDGPSLGGLLDAKTGQTVQELAAHLGKDRTWVSRQLAQLELAGKARRDQSGKKHLWYRE